MYDHLVFIHQQLTQRDIGIELQLFKNIVTGQGQLRYEVLAYNELLILTNASALPIGTRIISDSNSVEIDASQQSLEGLEQFSGLISIELPPQTTFFPVIEFIQIVKK